MASAWTRHRRYRQGRKAHYRCSVPGCRQTYTDGTRAEHNIWHAKQAGVEVHCAHDSGTSRGEQALCGTKVRLVRAGTGRFIDQLVCLEDEFTCKACRVALRKWQREEPLREKRARQEIRRQVVAPPKRQYRNLRAVLGACGVFLRTKAARIAAQVDCKGIRRLEQSFKAAAMATCRCGEATCGDESPKVQARLLYALLDACEVFWCSKALRLAVEIDESAVRRFAHARDAARRGDPRGWEVPWSTRALDARLDARVRWGA